MLCLQPGMFVVVRGRRSAAVVLIRLDRRGVRHIKDTLGTLHMDALQSSFDLHTRRIDDLRLVHESTVTLSALSTPEPAFAVLLER